LYASTRAKALVKECVRILNLLLGCSSVQSADALFLVSGEGLFVAEVAGRGVMFVSALGAIFQRQLREGEEWIGECRPLLYHVEASCHGGCHTDSHHD
jgi:hypothetical protein